MASRADRFGVTILSIIQGQFVYIFNVKKIGIFKQVLGEGMYAVDKALKEWADTEFSPKDYEKLQKKVDAWGEWIEEEGYTDILPTLVSMMDHCVNDLEGVTKSPRKRALLVDIQESIEELGERVDPGGNKYTSYEVVQSALKKLYLSIEAPNDIYTN